MAVGDAYVFSWLSHTSTNTAFQSHKLLFSHASAEVRGENTPERKVASTGDRTHNHQVMSPTRSPVIHPGVASCPRTPPRTPKCLYETLTGDLQATSPTLDHKATQDAWSK